MTADGARWTPSPLLALTALALVLCALLPSAAQAATCSDYATQADAQAAADTRDGDGDGRYCESLPCPCSGASGTPADPAPAPATPSASSVDPSGCQRPKGVQLIGFSRSKYPNIRRHWLDSIRRGWPRVYVLNRRGADARRERLLQNIPTRKGYDRDEAPNASGRGRGPRALRRGTDPVGWKADVELVPSSENRSHGAVLGIKLHRFCSGTRFRYVFY